MLTVEYTMLSERGLVRTENQDRILSCVANSNHFISKTENRTSGRFSELDFFGALVADGVGGSSDGGKAASAVQEGFTEFWQEVHQSKKASREDFIGAALKTHQKVLEENTQKGENSASTLVLIHLTSTFACLMNIGDSRGYFLRGEHWEQLTTDDTIFGTNQVLSAIGPELQSALSPHIVKYPIQEGDIFLLCSDGLDGMILQEDIFRIIKSFPKDTDLAEISERLFQQAMQHGGRDNCSIVLLKVAQLKEDFSTKDDIEPWPAEEKKELMPSEPEEIKTDATEEIHQVKELHEQNQQKLYRFMEKHFLEQEEHLLNLKSRLNQLETKALYVLGIFGIAQLILLFVFLLIFRFLLK